ncbi:hypothetical protein CHA01nite_05490 [Chryseobacterium hagamense]|uniref:Peptidase M56 domain-containing protein n=2 Tax=Chryseobacterium hagamense TaxID=395935 RepID=A0A511YHY4_9FLAO|nr:hypothetical protein CHA01nite_05490 [Chryseobacterium hagamense]
MLLSLLLPLIKVEDFTIEVSSDVYKLIDQIQHFNTIKNSDDDDLYLRIIFSALGLVSFCFLGRFAYGIFRIRQLKSSFPKETFDGINFYRTDLSEAPFSYFRNLFWKNSIMLNSDIGTQILKHEMVHIEQKHSFDKIFIEIITSIFWFNPFFHLIKKEISLIHEYLADKKAVKQSDTQAFAQMLLASHFFGNPLPATSPFLSSNLKKRLKMLQKPKTKFGYARRILALPVVFTVAFAYLVNAKNQEIRATNIEIKKAIARIGKDDIVMTEKDTAAIGKDTIVPDLKRTTPAAKIYRKADDDSKISDLSQKLQKKTEILMKLKPESDEYYKKLEEIRDLSGEIAKISVSKDFLKSGMIIKMDGKDINFNDGDFKINNKPERTVDWEIIQESDRKPVEMSDFDFNYSFDSKTADAPHVKVYTFKDTKDIKWSPEMEKAIKGSASGKKESPSMARKRAKLEKERARLEEKRAKLEGERAKLEAERRVLDGDRKVVVFSNALKKFPVEKNFKVDANNIRINLKDQSMMASGIKNMDGDMGNIKIYIDGKESTNGQMQALDPKNIRSVNINKKSADGSKASGEIRIETK